MDGLVQPRDRERSLYASPSFPRAPSRSSTSTSATRRTSHSANSSSSRLASSPRPASSHPSHRFHHTSCAQSTVTSRPASVASKDRGSESGRHSAASSYLQGKLQKRREEAERLAEQSTQSSNASMEPPPRNIQGSPLTSFADGHTPRSGGNGEPPKTGMGLKEMEAVSTSSPVLGLVLIPCSRRPSPRCTSRTSTSNLNSSTDANDRTSSRSELTLSRLRRHR